MLEQYVVEHKLSGILYGPFSDAKSAFDFADGIRAASSRDLFVPKVEVRKLARVE